MRLLMSLGMAAGLSTAWTAGQQPPPSATAAKPALSWYRGNTHAHTIDSADGDSLAIDVIRWYREHRYQFLVLSDHNTLPATEELNALASSIGPGVADDAGAARFLLIRGEEVSDAFSPRSSKGEASPLAKEVHVSGLGLGRLIAPQGGSSVLDVLQRNVDAVRAAGGVPIINHPNMTWALTADDLSQIRGAMLFELWSGHRQANNLGGGGSPSVEELWDAALSRGTVLYGVASDDSHGFRQLGIPSALAAPGRAWIMVRAERLTSSAILAAMERGDFYASTGVDLAAYDITPSSVSVTVQARSRSRYRVVFIGKGGRVLKTVEVTPDLSQSRIGGLRGIVQPAVYDIQGDEGYVRVKIIESNGQFAWTQPAFVKSRK